MESRQSRPGEGQGRASTYIVRFMRLFELLESFEKLSRDVQGRYQHTSSAVCLGPLAAAAAYDILADEELLSKFSNTEIDYRAQVTYEENGRDVEVVLRMKSREVEDGRSRVPCPGWHVNQNLVGLA